MIPAIALMVGAYIITRMVQLLIPADEHGKTNPIVLVLAAITILVTIYSVYSVIATGSSMPSY